MKESSFTSYDGVHLHRYEVSAEEPRFIVQIAHGMQEYSATYFEFAQFLAKNGAKVVLTDHRGHGKTAGRREQTGLIGETDIFKATVRDQIYITQKLKLEYPELPIIYIGHSYGSFIGQAYLETNPPVDKAILIGSSYMRNPTIWFGKIVARITWLFKGKNATANMIENMGLRGYAKKFTTGCWITSDQKKTEEFIADPLNARPFSAGFYYYMFLNQLQLAKKKNLEKVGPNIKVLILSGDQDTVSGCGVGVKKLYDRYMKAGINCKMRLYQGLRHGILQEKERYKVFADILRFIKDGRENA